MPGNKVRALISGSVNTANNLAAGVIAITLTQACFQIRIVNDSTVGISVRYGYDNQKGTIDNDVLRAHSDMEIITQTNALPPSSVALWPIGTTVAIQADALGVGLVTVTAYYQES
jgi:hypothetical protein